MLLDLKNELDDKLPQRLIRYYKNAAKNGIKIIKLASKSGIHT